MPNLRSISLSILSCALAVSAVLAGPAAIEAQSAAPTVRIVTPIDEGQLVTLKGNTNPMATSNHDRGPVSSSLSMADLTLVLSRSPESQAAFDAFVASQYDQNSPSFHQWLTPAEIGERFGPAQADITAITSWLTSHGFTVTSLPHDRMSIHFSGTAAQVEGAFHVEIHNLSVNGVPHIANMTDPQIPAALAPAILGLKGLQNFLPHPMHKLGSKVQLDQESGKWQRVPAAASTSTSSKASPALATSGGLRPQFGIGVPADPAENELAYLEEDIAPADFATIYNVQPLYTNSITGANQTIAIVGTSDLCLGQSGSPCNSVNDVATFRSAFGLSAGLAPEEVKGANGIDPGVCSTTTATAPCTQGDLLENSLDVEWSGAVAPGAQIVLVASGYNSSNVATITNDPLYQSAQYVIDNHGDSSYPMVSGATILSMSYGECELFNGTSSNVAYNNLWQSAAAEGISVFVSSGDSGSASCDDDQDQNYGNPYSAQFGLSVSGQASTPYNTAVGGTDFSWCKPTYASNGESINGCPDSLSSPGPYWNTSNTTSGESAKGYVPEIPWNDTCTNPIWAAFLESLAPIASASAGTNSSAGTTAEEACDWVENNWYPIDYYDEVDFSYFVDTIGGSGGASNCVANNADTYTGTGYPSCTSGATSTGATTNPTTGNAQASLTLFNNGWPKPSWQNTGIPGVPSDGVRDLPDVSFFAGDGELQSATLVCSSIISGTPCSATASGNGATTMIEVGGTSVATPEMAGVMALINQKVGTPQGLATPGLYKLAAQQTYSGCSSESVTTSSASCYFNDVDQGTNAMPCDLGATEGGDEGPTYPGVISPNCTAINSQDANDVGTLVSSGTTPGYNAALGYDLATGLGSLNVANVVNNWTSLTGTGTAALHVSLNPSSGTLPADATLTFTISVTGAGATPTGAITVSGGGYGATQSLTAGAATIVIPANSLAPGSQTLTVTYSGDVNYASTSTPETISVAADSPTVTVNAPNAQNVANSFVVSVSVSGPVGAPVPTGTVTLASGGYSSTAATLNSSGVANVTIPANSIAAGTNTLTATYSGSATYAGGTGSTTVSMSNASLLTPTVTVTPSPTSLDSSQALNVTVKVTGSGATPTGTVTLTSPNLTPAISGTLDITGTSPPLTIPANSLATGTDTLTFSYSGDANYKVGAGTSGNVTVTQSTFALTAGTPSSSSVTPGSSATVAISGATSSTGYAGTVTLNSCTLTSSSVTNANSPPTCSISGTITYLGGSPDAPTGSATATISTTAAVASLTYPTLPDGRRFLGAGGGLVLAFLVFLGIPARRRGWRAMLGMLVLIAALGTLSACGGGGSSGSTGNAIAATSAGTYTFTVTGSATPSVGASVTTTFTVTVN